MARLLVQTVANIFVSFTYLRALMCVKHEWRQTRMYVRTHSPKSAPSWCWRKCFPAARVAFPSLQVAPAAAAFAVPQPRAPVRTLIHFSHSCVLVCVGVMLHQSIKLPSARACCLTQAEHANKHTRRCKRAHTLTNLDMERFCGHVLVLHPLNFCVLLPEARHQALAILQRDLYKHD